MLQPVLYLTRSRVFRLSKVRYQRRHPAKTSSYPPPPRTPTTPCRTATPIILTTNKPHTATIEPNKHTSPPARHPRRASQSKRRKKRREEALSHLDLDDSLGHLRGELLLGGVKVFGLVRLVEHQAPLELFPSTPVENINVAATLRVRVE